MALDLCDLLSNIPKREQQKYLQLSDDLQSEIVHYIKRKGQIPPLQQLPILFGPDRIDHGEQLGWMAW